MAGQKAIGTDGELSDQIPFLESWVTICLGSRKGRQRVENLTMGSSLIHLMPNLNIVFLYVGVCWYVCYVGVWARVMGSCRMVYGRDSR